MLRRPARAAAEEASQLSEILTSKKEKLKGPLLGGKLEFEKKVQQNVYSATASHNRVILEEKEEYRRAHRWLRRRSLIR